MELIIVAGFFGSGKTTLLTHIATSFKEADFKKVAIIENEIGEAGIDGNYLKSKGLVVREIYSGCICCELKGDLLSTIRLLEYEYSQEWQHQLPGRSCDRSRYIPFSQLLISRDLR